MAFQPDFVVQDIFSHCDANMGAHAWMMDNSSSFVGVVEY
jgi:hypothetical protein